MNPPTDGPFVTKEYVMDILQCSESTLRRLELSNSIPAPIRLGRLVRWRLIDIENWFDDLSAPVKVEFAQPFAPYNQGEVATFSVHEAAILVAAGIATVKDPAQYERVKAAMVDFAKHERDEAAGQDQDGDHFCDE